MPCSNRDALGGVCSQVAAYSTQADKIINAGEGGFLTTGDEGIIARAIYMSGCYERRYGKREREVEKKHAYTTFLQEKTKPLHCAPLLCSRPIVGAVAGSAKLRNLAL